MNRHILAKNAPIVFRLRRERPQKEKSRTTAKKGAAHKTRGAHHAYGSWWKKRNLRGECAPAQTLHRLFNALLRMYICS